nr:G162 [uncultured bacterium]
MINIPTVTETMRRINSAITNLEHPRDRIMLEVYRDHWIAEVRNDMEAIMATLPEKQVSYRFDGIGLFIPNYLEFRTTQEARALYQGAADGDLPMAGPIEEERWAFADWGMTFEGVNTVIVRGKSLHIQPRPLDPEQLYFVRWRSISSHPIDIDRRLMLGEHVFGGAVIDVTAVEREAVDHMLS